mgnify:CR=1 FL=1
MGYFRELPNLLYQSFLPSKNSSLDYVEVKNLFRRAKLRDDLQSVFTLFTKYKIPEGYRPENVAEDYYGSDELDWVVLMCANGPENTSGIINVRNDWPLSNRNLYNFAYEKYGNDLNSTRFYETKEIKDSKGRLILPAGTIVDPDFTLSYSENGQNKTKSGTDVRSGISNYTYETRLNEKKSSIYLLKSEYLQQFLNDFRDIMIYDESTEYLNDNLIKTENTNLIDS